MDDFKFDAFRLDDTFEASVVAVNAEFELFFKLRAVGVLDCAGFVPLRLLLHTQMNASKHSTNTDNPPQNHSAQYRSLTELGKGNSNFTLASRSFGETPEGRWGARCEYTFNTLLPGYGGKYLDGPSVPEGAGRLMPLMM